MFSPFHSITPIFFVFVLLIATNNRNKIEAIEKCERPENPPILKTACLTNFCENDEMCVTITKWDSTKANANTNLRMTIYFTANVDSRSALSATIVDAKGTSIVRTLKREENDIYADQTPGIDFENTKGGFTEIKLEKAPNSKLPEVTIKYIKLDHKGGTDENLNVGQGVDVSPNRPTYIRVPFIFYPNEPPTKCMKKSVCAARETDGWQIQYSPHTTTTRHIVWCSWEKVRVEGDYHRVCCCVGACSEHSLLSGNLDLPNATTRATLTTTTKNPNGDAEEDDSESCAKEMVPMFIIAMILTVIAVVMVVITTVMYIKVKKESELHEFIENLNPNVQKTKQDQKRSSEPATEQLWDRLARDQACYQSVSHQTENTVNVTNNDDYLITEGGTTDRARTDSAQENVLDYKPPKKPAPKQSTTEEPAKKSGSEDKPAAEKPDDNQNAAKPQPQTSDLQLKAVSTPNVSGSTASEVTADGV